jgi:hypothetical protein
MAPGETEAENQNPLCFTPGKPFKDLPIKSGTGHFPYKEETPVWLELYFDVAPGTGINPHSLMERFSVEATGNAVKFSPRSVRDSGFTWSEKQEGWEGYERLEIRGFLTNTVHSGVVTFQAAAGLEDTRGNSSAGAYRISLLTGEKVEEVFW